MRDAVEDHALAHLAAMEPRGWLARASDDPDDAPPAPWEVERRNAEIAAEWAEMLRRQRAVCAGKERS